MTEGLCVGAFIRALCGLSNPHITHGKKLFGEHLVSGDRYC